MPRPIVLFATLLLVACGAEPPPEDPPLYFPDGPAPDAGAETPDMPPGEEPIEEPPVEEPEPEPVVCPDGFELDGESCAPSRGALWTVSLVRAGAPEQTEAGYDWDTVGGAAPDLFLQLEWGAEENEESTRVYADEYEINFEETLGPVSTVDLRTYFLVSLQDDDSLFHDVVGECEPELSDEVFEQEPFNLQALDDSCPDVELAFVYEGSDD